MRAAIPTSNQILAGKDHKNIVLSPNKVVKVSSDKDGKSEIYWPDLKPRSNYIVFITASIPRSYDPPLAWIDE